MFHLYGLFIGLAVVVGHSVAEKIEIKVNKVAPWVLGLGIVGARLYHVVDMWAYYSQNLLQIVAVWNGGLGIWGGIVGGGVGLVIAGRKFLFSKNELQKILGAIATAMPLAQAIGRLGNAVNGEFLDKVGTIPWWSAEALLDLVLFFVLWKLHLSRDYRKVVIVYLLGYFLIRLMLNPYRSDLR